MIVCPHRITGHCEDEKSYKKCGHGFLHKPIPCSGATCGTRTGVCQYTDYYVKCTSLHGKRKEQMTRILEVE